MLQLIVVGLAVCIAYLLEALRSESSKRKELENRIKELVEEVSKYKPYEYNYRSLKKSYLDLLDRTIGKRKKSE